MKEWNYAKLTSDAKQMGGPEKMIATIKSDARSDGRMDMVPWIGVAMAVGYGANWIVRKVRERIQRRKEDARKAEETLVEAMEEGGRGDSKAAEVTA